MSAPRTPWTVTALMALGTFVSMFALSTLIDGYGWMSTVAFVLVIACAASLAVRAASRSRVLPTAAALVASIVVMVPLFSTDEEGRKHVLPTPSGLVDLWHAIANGADYAANTPAPATATTELVALLAAFAVAIFIAADHLAASWRAVAVSGIVLMLPWTPAIFLQYQVPMWALFTTAACWMIALGAARSGDAGRRATPLMGAAVATIAALLATVLVAPAALGGNGWGAIPRFNAPPAIDTSTRLNLALDLRKSLTVNSAQTVMTYVSTGQHPDALRLYTLRDFDGTTWTREKDDPTDLQSVSSGVLWPQSVNSWDDANRVLLSFDLSGLAERSLPIPPVPRSVDVEGTWEYSPSRDEITTEGDGTHGLNYSIVADLEYFTADELQASQPLIDSDSDAVSASYTEIPTSVDAARLRSLASDITKDATTRYEDAVAIQNYLRSSANFTYDTSVAPAKGGDAVSAFLDDGRGYCVQFATTMVMLARSMGIPSRLAVGFLGGQLSDGDVWKVLGGDAHAWPELYFPGEGWVRFEPTPAVQSGAAPAYTVENSGDGNAPIPSNVPIPTTVPSSAPQTSVPNPTTEQSGDGSQGVPWWMLVAAVLVLGGAAAGVVVLRRRSASLAAAHGPEAAWAALRERLPEPLQWPLSATPIEAAQRLSHDLEAADYPLSDEATRALASLRDCVSDHRYAPPGQEEPTQDWLNQQVRLIAEEANEAVRSRPDRADARSAPQRGS
jgi:hypothetical protein